MRTAIAAIFAVFAAASPALALSVTECADNDPTSVTALAEPWEKNTKLFYNGNVRVAVVDTGGEPVCCSMHLLILLPVHQDGMDDTHACYIVNNEPGVGFVGIDFAHLTTRYDAGKGLLVTSPYDLYDNGSSPTKGGVAHVRVNVAKGTAAAE